MNKIAITFLIVLSSSTYGQFIKVVYQEINPPKVKIVKGNSYAINTVNTSRKLRGKIKFELFCNNTKALFKREDVLIDEQDYIAHILCYNLLFPGEVNYHDFKTNALITEGIKVNYPQKRYDWKLTGKTKTILGHTCQEAIAIYKYFDIEREIDASYIVRAWFTKDIKQKWGPFGLINLPGLVLEGSNDGKLTFRATEITTVKKFPKIPKYSEEKTYLQHKKDELKEAISRTGYKPRKKLK